MLRRACALHVLPTACRLIARELFAPLAPGIRSIPRSATRRSTYISIQLRANERENAGLFRRFRVKRALNAPFLLPDDGDVEEITRLTGNLACFARRGSPRSRFLRLFLPSYARERTRYNFVSRTTLTTCRWSLRRARRSSSSSFTLEMLPLKFHLSTGVH